jgi:hypothetical protein
MRTRVISVALAVLLFTSGMLVVASEPAGAATCPCSIWSPSTVPVVVSDSDTGSVELGLKFRADTAGTITGIRFYKGAANTGTHVGHLWNAAGTQLASVDFTGETASGWQQANFPAPVSIAAGQTYVVSYLAPNGRYAANNDYFTGQGVSNTPLQALASGVDGLNGVYRYGSGGFPTDSYRDTNYWVDVVFSSAGDPPPPPPPPPPTDGPGGPILVIAADGFGRYLGDILQAEGLNSYRVVDVSTLTSNLLAAYDVALLGPAALSAAQVTTLSNWVTGGGNLVAMKPDKQLAALLGLSTTAGTLAEGYLKVDTSAAPGAGIVADTMQFHGTADRYGLLAGTRQIAALYSNATTAAGNPAVTLRAIGSAGGQAAAFTYDLGRSVVYTRQGNPAWAGQERDGTSPKRSNDLFWGAAASDPQTDWVNPAKIAIPQADEQQRLLVNLIESMSLDRKPLPRFSYLPRGLKAAVVMSGDDHGNGGTNARFNEEVAASPSGCTVANWECIRSTSYIFPGTPITDAQATGFTNAGFEIGLHVNTNCGDFTAASLANNVATQRAALANQLPGNPPSVTNRTHCIPWSDWASQPTVEAANGIRLDTNYYYWPASWAATNPGLFTGSGFPMRFANTDGSRIDVYQAVTQMTDESGQAYPATINALLDRALGTDGFYGVFTANIHTDNTSNSPQSNAIIAAAKARGVPVISARQLLTWLDGRNSSAFGNLAWSTNLLTFNLTAGAGSNGLQALLPLRSSTGTVLTALTCDGAAVPFATQTIKGLQYGVFTAGAGAWRATFGVAGPADTTPPSVISRSPVAGATNVARSTNVTATFDEAVDPAGITFTVTGAGAVAGAVTYDAPSRTAIFNPTADLAGSTVQNVSVRARDVAGNLMAAATTWSFTTAAAVCPCSIWPDNPTPVSPAVSDSSAVELGLKFRSAAAGTITGVRFYKGAGNTGTHVGSLWSSTGALLGQVTFINETASGWQTATVASALAVSASTTYVVSYFAPNGHYAGDNNAFATAGVSNPPLQALANGIDGPNGVYRYGITSGFPTSSYQSSNYWVDVVFR